MKKLLILALLTLLVACEPTTETPEFELDCDIYPTHKDCQEEDSDDDTTFVGTGNYDNLGAGSDVVYEERDLVPEECAHLDNIGAWQPVWCDEFEYTGLPDDERWNYDVGGHGWGNNELQYYTFEDEDNAFVDNGVLTIRTIKESVSGSDYTSARLITKNTGDWLYGKVQVRAKVPAGRGTWPAIWMLPTDWEYGGWPDSGEIDIMEYVGYQPDVIHGTIHTGRYNHMLGTQVGKSRSITTAEEEFHVYEMEWEVGVIRLYIDGALFATFDYDPTDNTDVDSYQAWPFDKRFHLILNTAFGGNWGGAQGIDDTVLPVDFVIDYVRVYQKDYAGMDESAPSAVTNFVALDTRSDALFLSWTPATDDVMVKHYNIYQGDDLIARTTVNGHLISELQASTSYEFTIVAEDFAGNLSPEVTTSFTTATPPVVTDRIEAEDYNTMSGVQTETTTDSGGGENVGWVDADDTMTYLLTVTEAGDYEIDFRLASLSNGAHFDLYQGSTLLVAMDTAATGGWQNWQTFTSGIVTLQEGTYEFTIRARDGGFNINYFTFRKVN